MWTRTGFGLSATSPRARTSHPSPRGPDDVLGHFPARADLTLALWERIRDTTGSRWPRTEAAILPALRVTLAQFDEHAALTRAAIASAASTGHPVHGSAEGRAAFREALADLLLVAPPMSGPPRHVHTREDERFYVLEGELVFQLDGARHTVGPGGTVYSPRGVVHAYQNFTTSDARLLIATMPGAFGVMFEEMSAATPPGGMPAMDVPEALHRKHGITTMGPPLSA